MVLISRELRSLLDSNSSTVNVNVQTMYGNAGQLQSSVESDRHNLMIKYFKRRAFSIIYTVIVLILLVTTSLFTDMGLNIGQVLYNAVSSFLGF